MSADPVMSARRFGPGLCDGVWLRNRISGLLSRHRSSGSALALLPASTFLLVFFVYPLVVFLLQSVYDTGWNFRHYQEIWTSPVYTTVLFNTLKVGVVVTACCLILGYPLAVLLATASARIRNLLMIAVIVPYFTSILVRSYAWLVLLGREGIINSALAGAGIIDEPIRMIFNTSGVIISMTHIMLPVMVLVLYGVIKGVDLTLLKTSASLGAGGLQTFFRVLLPLSMPGIAAGSILVFIISIGFYVTPALLGGLRNTMIAMLIATQITDVLNWGLAGALSVVLLVATLLLFWVFYRLVGLESIWGAADGRARAKRPMLRPKVAQALLDGAVRWWWAARGARQRAAGGGFSPGAGEACAAPSPRGARRHGRWSRLALWAFCVIVLVFLLMPIVLIIPISFSSARFLEFPPRDLSLRWYRELYEVEYWARSAWLSFRLGVTAAVVGVILGSLAAIALVRGSFRGKQYWYMFLLSPMIVPLIVLAVSYYYFLSEIGLLGTFAGLALSHVVLVVPIVAIVMVAALKGFDVSLEQAAMSLGASRLRAVRDITIPILKPSLIVSAFFAFIQSFDEVVVASFISGFSAETLPKKMWEGIRLEISPTLAAASTLLIVLTSTILLLALLVERRGNVVSSKHGSDR